MQKQTGFVALQDARLYFEITGAGSPVLLLHAGIADHRMWDAQCAELAKQFRLIVPDLRGYGLSNTENLPFRHSEDVHALIQHLELDTVSVAGCSIGGRVALDLAITHPEDVGALILVAPGLRGYDYKDEETLAKDAILEELIASDKREEAADMLVDIWVVGLHRSRAAVSSGIRSLVRGMILDNFDAVADRFQETTAEHDMISRLSDIDKPTLIIVGNRDLPDMQAISKLIVEKIPGAKRLVIPGTAHFPNLEKASLFNRAVAQFLASA